MKSKAERKEAKQLKKERLAKRTPMQKFIDRLLKAGIWICVAILLFIGVQYLWQLLNSRSVELTPAQVQANNKKPFKNGKLKDVSRADLSRINWNLDGVIGAIYIPKTNTQTMITKGINENRMLQSVGTMRSDQQMGKGNYPLAGHNMDNESILFSGLPRVTNGSWVVQRGAKKGDKIYITDASKVYTYKVDYSKLVPTNGATSDDIINNHKGKTQISLVTCLNGESGNLTLGQAYTPAERVFVRGTYVGSTTVKKAPTKIKEAFNLDHKSTYRLKIIQKGITDNLGNLVRKIFH